MGVVVGFHGRRCIAVHRDHDVSIWIDKDKLPKDAFRHIHATAVQPPLVTVAFIAFRGRCGLGHPAVGHDGFTCRIHRAVFHENTESCIVTDGCADAAATGFASKRGRLHPITPVLHAKTLPDFGVHVVRGRVAYSRS